DATLRCYLAFHVKAHCETGNKTLRAPGSEGSKVPAQPHLPRTAGLRPALTHRPRGQGGASLDSDNCVTGKALLVADGRFQVLRSFRPFESSHHLRRAKTNTEILFNRTDKDVGKALLSKWPELFGAQIVASNMWI